MFNLNEAFDKLRRKVPTFAYEKRLSRIETLRLAITYISFMTELLHGHHGSMIVGAPGNAVSSVGIKGPHSPSLSEGATIYGTAQRDYHHIPYGLIN